MYGGVWGVAPPKVTEKKENSREKINSNSGKTRFGKLG